MFLERENYKIGNSFLDILILISREREREFYDVNQKTLPAQCYNALNLKQMKLELWRVRSFNCSETVSSHAKMMERDRLGMWGTTSFFMTSALFAFAVASHARLKGRWRQHHEK